MAATRSSIILDVWRFKFRYTPFKNRISFGYFRSLFDVVDLSGTEAAWGSKIRYAPSGIGDLLDFFRSFSMWYICVERECEQMSIMHVRCPIWDCVHVCLPRGPNDVLPFSLSPDTPLLIISMTGQMRPEEGVGLENVGFKLAVFQCSLAGPVIPARVFPFQKI